jgi:hypothetical protein
VSDLADLLVQLHGARGRISTVRATVRMWRHARREGEALERAGWTGYAPIGDAPEVIEERVRVWRAPPDRVREEGRRSRRVGCCAPWAAMVALRRAERRDFQRGRAGGARRDQR